MKFRPLCALLQRFSSKAIVFHWALSETLVSLLCNVQTVPSAKIDGVDVQAGALDSRADVLVGVE